MEQAWLVIKAKYRRVKYKTQYCTKIIKGNRVLFEFSAGNLASVETSSVYKVRKDIKDFYFSDTCEQGTRRTRRKCSLFRVTLHIQWTNALM